MTLAIAIAMIIAMAITMAMTMAFAMNVTMAIVMAMQPVGPVGRGQADRRADGRTGGRHRANVRIHHF